MLLSRAGVGRWVLPNVDDLLYPDRPPRAGQHERGIRPLARACELREAFVMNDPVYYGCRQLVVCERRAPLRELSDLQRPPAARIAVVGALGGPEFVEHESEWVVMSGRVRRLRPIPFAKALIRFLDPWLQFRLAHARLGLLFAGEERGGGPSRSAFRLGASSPLSR